MRIGSRLLVILLVILAGNAEQVERWHSTTRSWGAATSTFNIVASLRDHHEANSLLEVNLEDGLRGGWGPKLKPGSHVDGHTAGRDFKVVRFLNAGTFGEAYVANQTLPGGKTKKVRSASRIDGVVVWRGARFLQCRRLDGVHATNPCWYTGLSEERWITC